MKEPKSETVKKISEAYAYQKISTVRKRKRVLVGENPISLVLWAVPPHVLVELTEEEFQELKKFYTI